MPGVRNRIQEKVPCSKTKLNQTKPNQQATGEIATCNAYKDEMTAVCISIKTFQAPPPHRRITRFHLLCEYRILNPTCSPGTQR